LSTFIDDCRREIPNELVNVTNTVDSVHYEATAIIKHVAAQKKFPIVIFEQPLNLHSSLARSGKKTSNSGYGLQRA